MTKTSVLSDKKYLYQALRFVIYGAAYATERFFSLVFFSHYNDFWYLTLHFTQTKKYASTSLRIQIFMNELDPFENLSKSWGKKGKKDSPVLLNRISSRYMVIQERSKKCPCGHLIAYFTFTNLLGFWSPFHTQMLWNQMTCRIPTKSSNMVYFKPDLAWRSRIYLVNLLNFTNCSYLQAKWAFCSNRIFIIFDLLDIWTLLWAYDVMQMCYTL